MRKSIELTPKIEESQFFVAEGRAREEKKRGERIETKYGKRKQCLEYNRPMARTKFPPYCPYDTV